MISAVILLSHLLCCLAEVQRECPATERCLPQNNCTEFLEKKEKYDVSKDQKLLTELRSQVCDSAEKKVCCEKSVDSGQPLSTRSTEPLKKETEEPLTTGQCGQAQIVPANIIGGENTDKGEFPFLALIGRSNVPFAKQCFRGVCKNLTETKWDCGANIIATQFLLTAAHCRVVRFTDSFIVR